MKTKQNHIGEIIHNNLNSVLSWNTFGSDYSLMSGWVWCHKLCISGFGEFLPIFSADHLKLCQVGWRPFVDSYFQVSPEMFDWIDWMFDWMSHDSCIFFAVCLRSLSSWKVNPRHSLRSWLWKTPPQHDATTSVKTVLHWFPLEMKLGREDCQSR